jgi:hypothetical protein
LFFNVLTLLKSQMLHFKRTCLYLYCRKWRYGDWEPINLFNTSGGFKGGGGGTRRAPPLKLEKIRFVGVKSWFFTRNTPKIFAPPSAIGKNMIFWRKIVIFSHEIPQQCSRLPLLGATFLSAPPPPNLKSWIRPWTPPHVCACPKPGPGV